MHTQIGVPPYVFHHLPQPHLLNATCYFTHPRSVVIIQNLKYYTSNLYVVILMWSFGVQSVCVLINFIHTQGSCTKLGVGVSTGIQFFQPLPFLQVPPSFIPHSRNTPAITENFPFPGRIFYMASFPATTSII